MEDLLTTRQVIDILKVDRITVYRMLQDGRIKGVKIGQQWRFPRREVERLVSGVSTPEVAEQVEGNQNFPVHCVQTIQELFSDVGQVSALVIDKTGDPLTEVSHACEFCMLMLNSPSGQAACRASWKEFAQNPEAGGKPFTCHAGLQYLSAPIMDEEEPIGWFLSGQFYWQAADPTQEAQRIRRLATTHSLELQPLQQAAHSIQVIEHEQRPRLESWPLTASRAVQSILHERIVFMTRLQQIANLTQI